MCLYSLTKVFNVRESNFGIGWKQFDVDDGKLYPTNFGNKEYVIGKWNKASGDTKCVEEVGVMHKYKLGFHIFLSEKDARDYSSDPNKEVRMVRYRKVTSIGKQTTGKASLGNQRFVDCVIAGEMMVM